MEFHDMLKQGLNDIPGPGFTNRMKNQVLRDIAGIRPQKPVRKTKPWALLTGAVAVCVAGVTCWGVYTHAFEPSTTNQPDTLVNLPTVASKTQPNQTITIAPAHVSVTGGIGDTLDVLKQDYGTPTQVTPAGAGLAEYDFAHGISAWVNADGRVLELHRTFTGSQMHSSNQMVFLMTPKDSLIQGGGPRTQGSTQVFTFLSPSLAKAFPSATFGKTVPGTYRVLSAQSASSVTATIIVGDATPHAFVQGPTDRPAQTTLTYDAEGMKQSDPAKLFKSPQGYSLYILNRFTASTEEPGSDIVWLNANHAFTMRIQELAPDAKVDDVIGTAKQQLNAVGATTVVDPVTTFQDQAFKSADFVGFASTKTQRVQIIVMQVAGRPFQFTFTVPTEAESLNPLYAMIKTIDK